MQTEKIFSLIMKYETAKPKMNVTAESLRKKLEHLSVSTVRDADSLKSELRSHTIDQVSSSKESATLFLIKAGIFDEKGKLSSKYR